jgi:DNA-binding MarR family transcriptional regulator
MLREEQKDELWPRENTPAARFLFEQGAVLRAARAAFQRRVGMSEARLQALGMIFRFGEMSQAELQRRLDVDGAAVTRQVKQLESEGLLVRRVDPSDNRFTLVTLTPEGTERLREVGRMAKEFIAQSLDGISDEDLECVRAVTARVRANIEKL